MNYWLVKSEPFKYSWEQFCKDKKTTLRIDLNADIDIDLNTDEVAILSQIIQNNKLIIEYEYYINKSSYVCDFARMKPSLLSSARLKLSSIMHAYVDNIVKRHTDGFMSDTKLDIVLGDDIGNILPTHLTRVKNWFMV